MCNFDLAGNIGRSTLDIQYVHLFIQQNIPTGKRFQISLEQPLSRRGQGYPNCVLIITEIKT